MCIIRFFRNIRDFLEGMGYMGFLAIVFWCVWTYNDLFVKPKLKQIYEDTKDADEKDLNW